MKIAPLGGAVRSCDRAAVNLQILILNSRVGDHKSLQDWMKMPVDPNLPSGWRL